MRVLLIEDDAATAKSVELMLKANGFAVQSSDLGEEGLDLAKVYDFDAILLDLGLPDISGLEVLRRLRASRIATPVMVVTGSADHATEIKAFSTGADDFLGKPFHRDVLLQRLHALIRRSGGHSTPVIQVGRLAIDLNAKTCRIEDRPLHLTGKEFKMLELMALRTGATITKDQFLNHLYGGMDEPELKIIDVFICKIRNKLRKFGASYQIETIWGRGYRLVSEITARSVPERPKADLPAMSMKGRILARLRAGDATFADLCAMSTAWNMNSVRGTLSILLAEGQIGNVGPPRAAIYRAAKAVAA